jgi:uncharacterized DUF497 family protein
MVVNLNISPSVLQKINQKHQVSENEVNECFLNMTHGFLNDTREDHKTEPETQWFMSKTDTGRELKVCFIKMGDEIVLKTSFAPTNKSTQNMYYRKAREL